MIDKVAKHAILVPVDFSPHSEAALTLASELAACLNAHLVVLHVVHDPGEAPGSYARALKGNKKRLRKMEDVAKEMMDEFLKKVAKEHPDLKPLKKAQPLLVVGLPVARILEVVEKTHSRMVVMGSQGRTGLKHMLLGSKAEQVVQLCPVPVTIVKVHKT